MNRRIRDPYVRWCERRTPSVNFGGAVYSIGDYLSNIEFPYIYDSITRYRNTLEKLEGIIANHDVKILISGHGDITTEKEEMYRRIAVSKAYLDLLESAVRENKSFDLEALLMDYDFPGIMTKFHNANMELTKKEIGGQFV